MEVVSDGSCGRWGEKKEILQGSLMSLDALVVLEMPQVDLAEDLLESDVLVVILLEDVGVRLLEVVVDVPDVQRWTVPQDQPHLILIKYLTRQQSEVRLYQHSLC